MKKKKKIYHLFVCPVISIMISINKIEEILLIIERLFSDFAGWVSRILFSFFFFFFS